MHKPVLITGASSGIGEAAAIRLARAGFRVYAGARRVDKLKALEGLGEGRITALALDVTDPASIGDALERIKDDGATLYGLVNNAGVSVTGPVEEVPLEEWRREFETNVFGLVAMTNAVMPQMRAAGAGRIVNIGSVAGRIVSPFMGVYAASKHAVEGVSDAQRREFALHGVKVSLIRPGFINTPFGEQEQQGFEPYMQEGRPYARAVAAFKAWHAKGHPAGAAPAEVAEKIHHALTATRPHSRYTAPAKYVGPLMLRNLLPSALTDRMLARVTGIDRAE
ncbi:MAG: SDR family oxidoreductase [Pseudomonadota bacterium]|nr:SDR family oxidoreductase [Pseudomonadota bacterium]